MRGGRDSEKMMVGSVNWKTSQGTNLSSEKQKEKLEGWIVRVSQLRCLTSRFRR